MSNLPALIQNGLSGLRRLTLQEIFDAYFARTPICGFYIAEMGVGAAVSETAGLKNIKLVHAETFIEIGLDDKGNATVRT